MESDPPVVQGLLIPFFWFSCIQNHRLHSPRFIELDEAGSFFAMSPVIIGWSSDGVGWDSMCDPAQQ